jgi:lipopolysaccharide/colanic/teichoic acid biosynthesis glycosyltransferase
MAQPTSRFTPPQHETPEIRGHVSWRGKRALDVVLGVLLVIVTLPVMIIVTFVSLVSLHSWPVFVQRRVGKDGALFQFPKIRTLPKTTDRSVDKYAVAKLRIPRPCVILRKTHLDELPQLFCVVRGTMSLIGPRPEVPKILERYPSAFAARRSVVRPGCTGLWQISVENNGMIYEAPEYDDFYVRNACLGLDAWILLRTVGRLVSPARGAISAVDYRGRFGSRPVIAEPEPELDLIALHDEQARAVDQPVTADLPAMGRPASLK